MRALLDTQVWLWMLTEPARLPPRIAAILEDPRTEPLLSAASAWEMSIKYDLGRLPLPEAPLDYVPSRLIASGTTRLPIDHGDALVAGALPRHHRDPFDRMLVAQAQQRRIPLVSADPALAPYDVELLWD